MLLTMSVRTAGVFEIGGRVMPFDPEYHEEEPTREEVNRMDGPVVLEFGAAWCGFCRGFSPQLEALLEEFPDVQHVRIADGKGKPLGRSFRVTLWPTLVFLRDGRALKQAARPSREEAREGLEAITAAE